MTREILFKALEFGTKRWVLGYPVLFVDANPRMITNMGEKDIVRKTVCQYTGLKESDGERIFEGDEIVVEHKLYNETVYVSYVEDQFMICEYDLCGTDVSGLYQAVKNATVKLTGRNIHDPE